LFELDFGWRKNTEKNLRWTFLFKKMRDVGMGLGTRTGPRNEEREEGMYKRKRKEGMAEG
jgi:hypothetical protein